VRWYTGAEGDRRLWLEPDEIEAIMEDKLRDAKLVPSVEQPVTDLECLVEIHLGSPLDQHAYLPADVLGLTEFRSGRPPVVSINRDLTGSALDEEDSPLGLRGRWRATLAHEASHVILHRVLFEVDGQESLFPEEVTFSGGAMMRCLKRDVGYGRRANADWREVQANRGMAALLMPRRVFHRVTRRELADIGISRSALKAGDPKLTHLVRRLAERFEVSRQAASIRLSTLRYVEASGTLPVPPAATP